MATLRQGIYDLLSSVKVDTKEFGRSHITPWLSQRMVIDGICDGLENDIHTFVVLKSRQMGITQVCSIIELFWVLAHDGIQAAIVADRGDNLERLRRIFAQLLQTLPPEWRGPKHTLTQNNRQGLAFANGSVVDLLAAANNPDLGASRALSLAHLTECSLWKNLGGVESLNASMAKVNPNRLFIYESIANGPNWYYDLCQRAKTDRHMKFLFCGFWANPTYNLERDDPDYRIYWDGHLTEEELQKARFVRQEYNYTIQPGQIGWWRRESEYRAPEHMSRHYPWHERECFIASGSGFFPAKRTLELAEALGAGVPFQGYKYTFEEEFLRSRIEQTRDPDQVNLRVWEHPQNDWIPGGRDEQGRFLPDKPPGVYVVGVDPSGGGGGESDDHAIQVLRCYADRCVQVAEFQTNQPLTYQISWVLAHLCGCYRDHICNLEVSGIGAAVLPEIRNLRQLALRGVLVVEPNTNQILSYIGNVRWFLYKRPDTLGGIGNVIAWKTSSENKQQTYSELRDSIMLRRIELRSPRLIKQLQAIVEDQGRLGAGPDMGENDDLVSALVLAHHAWVEQRQAVLLNRGMTWQSVQGPLPPQDISAMLSAMFNRHMTAVAQKQTQRRERF